MNPEELAQKLADYFHPPRYEKRRRTDLKPKELRQLPVEEQYEEIYIRRGPDSQTYQVRYLEDGPSIGALTYLEIAKAIKKIEEAETNSE